MAKNLLLFRPLFSEADKANAKIALWGWLGRLERSDDDLWLTSKTRLIEALRSKRIPRKTQEFRGLVRKLTGKRR